MDIDYILGNTQKTRRKPSKGIAFSSYKTQDPLRDLFGIKPSYRSKPKSNIVNQDFLSGFIGQGHPRPDRKTKQQKAFLKKTRIGSGKSHLRFMDFDGDGVIAGLDCEYKNPKKHMARYISSKTGTVYRGKDMSHYDINPEVYDEEIEEMKSPMSMDPFSRQAIRFSTEKDAESDSYTISNARGDSEKFNAGDKRIVVKTGPLDSWEENMENSFYRNKFLKGVSAIQKADKYGDEVPVFNPERQSLGTVGSIKDNYGSSKPLEMVERKYVDTDKAYEMRSKAWGKDDMQRVSRPGTKESLEKTYSQGGRVPAIEVGKDDFNKGILRDGKHRILAAQTAGRKQVAVDVYQDEDED